jgi:hypothetical protein
MSAVGYEATRWGGPSHVRLCLRKRTIRLTAAAHNDLLVGYVSFAIPKRKKLAVSNFVAS